MRGERNRPPLKISRHSDTKLRRIMEIKICPLKKVEYQNYLGDGEAEHIAEWHPCLAEQCAWWCKYSKRCAILELASKIIGVKNV